MFFKNIISICYIEMYHSQFQDCRDFFWHAAPSKFQISYHQEARIPCLHNAYMHHIGIYAHLKIK